MNTLIKFKKRPNKDSLGNYSSRYNSAFENTKTKFLFVFVMVFGILFSNFADTNAQDNLFFSRASNLGPDHVWVVNEFSEGEYKLDLKIMRWANGGWTRCVAGKDCSKNDGRLTWGTPVYAPVDGVIRTCWRNFDDNPKPGVEEILDKVTGANGVKQTIIAAGNHINIETSDGKIFALAHLKKGSVPAALCPNNAEELADKSKKTGSYPTEILIPSGQRPSVKKGEFIGYAGNSGNSTGPHVHIEINKETGVNTEGEILPIKFSQGWAHPFNENENFSSNGWFKLDSKAITKSGTGNTMILPSPFMRRSSEEAGTIFSVKPAFLSSNRLITAVEDADHNLKLISWDYTGLNDIVRKHDKTEGKATLVNLVRASDSQMLAGVRTLDGNLRLILYQIGITGAFTRQTDHTAGEISALDMVEYGTSKKFVTAVRLTDGKLKIIVWKIEYSSGTAKIKRLGDIVDEPISDVSITPALNFNGVVAAVRTSNNKLKMIPFKISSDGMTLTKGSTFTEDGTILGKPDVTVIPRGVVAAMRDSDGKLKVISFYTSTAGNIVAKRGSEKGGSVSEVDIQRTPHSGSNVITTVRSDGDLILIAWTMDDEGRKLRRSGSSKAGNASMISTASAFHSQGSNPPRDFIMTAVRLSNNNLKLINWESNLNP